MQKIIGGEFEIPDFYHVTKDALKSVCKDFSFFSSGRGALHAVLQSIKEHKGVKRILLPDYLCNSIVTTVKACNLEYEFYSLNANLSPELISIEHFLQPNDSILVINYFGLLKLENIYEAIKKIDCSITVIEDNVQALPTFLTSIPAYVDYSFTSLRKWLPVPDGGLAKSNDKYKLTSPQESNSYFQYKLSGLFLKSKRDKGYLTDDSIYLDLLSKGESLIDANLNCAASNFTIDYFYSQYPQFNFTIRKRNADYLLKGLGELGINSIIDVPSDVVPFFVPLWLNNRDSVRKEMFKDNIFCPIHWPLEGLKLKKGAEMAEHELSLIIDQRYTFSDLDRILSILDK